MASFKLVIRKSNTKKNGLTPIFLRVHDRGKDVYLHTGFEIYPHEWVPSKGLPKNERLANYLRQMLLQAQLDFVEGKSIATIKAQLHGQDQIEFDGLYQQLYLKEKKVSKRNAEAWKTAMDSFRRFLDRDVVLEDFQTKNLESFIEYLTKSNKSRNTVSVYLRSLRAVYRRVSKEYDVQLVEYPFIKGLVPKPSDTAKRSISTDSLTRILEVQLDQEASFCRDIWILMFCLGGIDLLDIAHSPRLKGDYIYFRRMKMSARGNEFKIIVPPIAQEIINRYKGKESLIGELQYKSVSGHRKNVKRINEGMAEVEQAAGIPQRLTTKVARHTFSTIARNMGYDMELIGVLMGHEIKSVTNIYTLYSQKMLDEAVLNVSSTALGLH